MTIYSPDTCDCKVEFNDNINWIKTHNVCRLHNGQRGQTLLDSVLAQNRRFNLAFGRSISNPQRELIDAAKGVNRLRIRKEDLTNFDEHLPSEQPLSFFQNLRRLLRLNP